jgi:hypothetical protein
MPLLAQFGSWLLGGLLSIIPSLVGKALISLGIGVVTYSGLSASLDWLKSSFITAASGLPPEVVGMLSLMKVGSCVSMIFSAMAIRMVILGMTGDTFKRWTKP